MQREPRLCHSPSPFLARPVFPPDDDSGNSQHRHDQSKGADENAEWQGVAQVAVVDAPKEGRYCVAQMLAAGQIEFTEPSRFEFLNIPGSKPLRPVSRHRLLPRGDQASQGAPHQSGCRPSRSRHRSDLVFQDHRAGRCRSEIQHWRRSHRALAVAPASTPATQSDNAPRADVALRAPSPQPSSTGDVRCCP